jgi:hypothetical protein
VHNQTKRHTNEHAKCLEDWFLKELHFTIHSNRVQLHHRLGANAACCSGYNRGNENDELSEPTFCCGAIVPHDYDDD